MGERHDGMMVEMNYSDCSVEAAVCIYRTTRKAGVVWTGLQVTSTDKSVMTQNTMFC